MHIWNELTYINKSSLALGFFDGLHQGHNVVLKNTINIAKENKTNSCVITFKEHPMNVLSNQYTEQIITLKEKLNMLDEIGIENVVLIDFKDIMNIKAEDYLKNIIIKYFSPVAITTGFNHYFGFNKEGNSEFLKEKEKDFGYKYYEIPPYVVNSNVVSCSVIRNFIHLGNFYDTNKLLGYNFFIEGIVKEGDKIARKLGYPSANIEYPEDKIKIPFGVYFVKVSVDNKEYNGIFNFGTSPTFENNQKAEVHILDFNKNIYGEKIKISFISKIRNQIKFENKEKLKEQLKRDSAFAVIYNKFIESKIL